MKPAILFNVDECVCSCVLLGVDINNTSWYYNILCMRYCSSYYLLYTLVMQL